MQVNYAVEIILLVVNLQLNPNTTNGMDMNLKMVTTNNIHGDIYLAS